MSVNKRREIRNLVLVGFMATGKSSVGRLIARDLGFSFLDTDAEIELRAGKPISAIFAEEGEARFRAYESEVVIELRERSRMVIATGGGLAANPANLASLKEHALVVCLWASVETIWRRASRQSHRPLLQTKDPENRIRELLATRSPFYRQADVLVSTDRRSVRVVADHITREFRRAVAELSRAARAS